MFAVVALFVVACGAPPGPSTSGQTTSSSTLGQVHPGRIDRVRGALPDGYETADITGRIAPVALWGFGPGWTADPPQCGALAEPLVEPVTTKGWSGSGPGGIVYAVVAQGQASLDPALIRRVWGLDAVGGTHVRQRHTGRRAGR